MKKTQTLVVKSKITNLKVLTKSCLKNDVIILTDSSPKYIDRSESPYGIDSVFCNSTPSFTWKVGLEMTKVQLFYIADDKLKLLLDNNLQGGPSSVKLIVM